MVKQITSVKVFTTGDQKIAMDMNASVKKYLKGSKLQELMRIKEGDQSVKFFISKKVLMKIMLMSCLCLSRAYQS